MKYKTTFDKKTPDGYSIVASMEFEAKNKTEAEKISKKHRRIDKNLHYTKINVKEK